VPQKKRRKKKTNKYLRVKLLMSHLLTLLLEMLVAQYQGNTTSVIYT
jgi:hypothetical protein